MAFRRSTAFETRTKKSADLAARALSLEVLEPRLTPAVDLLSVGDPSVDMSQFVSGDTYNLTLSADGRYLAFQSEDSRLVENDDNGVRDVFVKDLTTGEINLVSTDTNGVQGRYAANGPLISADGQFVVFWSDPESYSTTSSTATSMLYLKNLITGELTAIPKTEDAQQPSISGDGRYVAFSSSLSTIVPGDTFGSQDLFVYDMVAGTYVRANVNAAGVVGNRPSYFPLLSRDGTKLAFKSQATNLTETSTIISDTLYVKDLIHGGVVAPAQPADGIIAQLSINELTVQFSPNGRFIAFGAYGASPLTGVPSNAHYLYEFDTGELSVLRPDTQMYEYAIDDQGRLAAYLSYTDVLSLRRIDPSTGVETSITSEARWVFPLSDHLSHVSISDDASVVAFLSKDPRLVDGDVNANYDVFVWTAADDSLSVAVRPVADTESLSGYGDSTGPSVDSTGRYVVYEATADLPSLDQTNRHTDVFLRDRELGTTMLVSAAADGTPGDQDSKWAMISGNGRYVVFYSTATNLVPSGVAGVYRKDVTTGAIELVAAGASAASINYNGRYVAYTAHTSQAGGPGGASYTEVWIKDMTSGALVNASRFGSSTQYAAHMYNPSLSPDGEFVVFETTADLTGVVNSYSQIFARNLETGELILVSATADGTPANNDSRNAVVSRHGYFVAFESTATNLGALGTTSKIFVKNLLTGELTWASRMPTLPGGPPSPAPKGASRNPSFSYDGRYLAFETNDSNLLGVRDVSTFEIVVIDSQGFISRPTLPATGQGPGDSIGAALSGDGRYVVFESTSSRYVADDHNDNTDVFGADVRFAPAAIGASGVGIVYEGDVEITTLYSVNDPDSDAWTFALVAGLGSYDNDRLEIVGSKVRAIGGVDYQGDGGLRFRVRATDADGQWVEQAFVGQVVNQPPAFPFDDDPAADEVVEAAPFGTRVGITASAPDPGGGPVTYSLVSDDLGRFGIHSQTGVITTKSTSLNAEEYQRYIRVRATDSRGAYRETTFYITITNAPPNPIPTPASMQVYEGYAAGSTVGRITTTDPGGGEIAYSLVDDAGGRFSIDEETGWVRVAITGAVDYESSGGSYTIRVRARDQNQGSVERDIVVTVRNRAPTNAGDSDPAANAAPEGAAAGTPVGVTATAFDPAGGTLTYSLNNYTDRFTIDASTGVISVADGATFDFDLGATYTVEVKAEDSSGLFVLRSHLIGVSNVAAAAPEDSDIAANSILENAAAGTTVGVTAYSTDAAGGLVTYHLADSAGGRFAIDETTGVVTVASGAVIDFEASGGGFTIVVESRDSAGSGESTSFRIEVVNRPPTSPYDSDLRPNVVSETMPTGAAVGIVAASNDPAGGVLHYVLVDSAAGLFSIDSSGAVRLADRSRIADEAKSYRIVVRAFDQGGAFADAAFTLQVQHNILAVASASGKSRVMVYDAASRTVLASFNAFPKSFKGGVRVATGDVNGDGVSDIIVTSGAGTKTKVNIYDGTKLHLDSAKGDITAAALIASLAPFGNRYSGGAYLAVADLNGDHFSEILVGSGLNRSNEVRIYDGATRGLMRILKPFPKSFKGGATVAAGDLNGDHRPDIVVGQATAGNQVRAFDGQTGILLAAFKPFGSPKRGLDVAVGDVNGDGRGDLVVSAAAGGTPSVRAFSGVDYGLVADFLAYRKNFKQGVQITTLDVDGDGRSEIVTGDGPKGIPTVRLFSWTGALVEEVFARLSTLKGGISLD